MLKKPKKDIGLINKLNADSSLILKNITLGKFIVKKTIFILIIFSVFGAYIFRVNQISNLSAENEISAKEILDAHNKYRLELNIPPLKWSDKLAVNAKLWSDRLAREGGKKIYHSSGTGEGENIWWGTSGRFTYTQMVDGWGGEKKYYKHGNFPNVSKSGNWADVGHYTQLIWKNTTEVGCGKSTAGGFDIFVCRYSPPGNYMGQKAY